MHALGKRASAAPCTASDGRAVGGTRRPTAWRTASCWRCPDGEDGRSGQRKHLEAAPLGETVRINARWRQQAVSMGSDDCADLSVCEITLLVVVCVLFNARDLCKTYLKT